jgi:tRNA nucleotidyltransferase (CCA-adding enzyme)
MTLELAVDPRILEVARQIRQAGGRALLVGGIVRDHLLGIDSKDYDLEVFGLSPERLEAVLKGFGEVIAIGRAFGVLRLKGLEADFSLPRRDSKTGRGHRGFLVEVDPALDFREAARRRDLTVNSLGFDPLTGELLDPWGGLEDLRQGRLRATDPAHFAEDTLRGLRVAQFAARFPLRADAELEGLCRGLDLSDLPGERILEELKKLLVKGERPSLGFELLQRTDLLRFFPELAAMVGVEQDPVWHPEGTVWEHTLLVLDEAVAQKSENAAENLALMWGALLHDVGKPATTFRDGERVRSPGHEEAGVPLTEALLQRLRAPQALLAQVVALVRFHLAPAQFPAGGAKDKAYRRLARRLAEAGIDHHLLMRLARADHFGRTTPDALAREFPDGDAFLERMNLLGAGDEAVRDVVLGRHLIQRGWQPGPRFGPVLQACRDLQDETGWTDAEQILDRVLADHGAAEADLSPIEDGELAGGDSGVRDL